MKNIFFLIFVSKFFISYAQENHQTIDGRIAKLNWNSLVIVPNYASYLSIDSNAFELVVVSDSTLLKKLCENLSNPEKTVVIHWILTKRLEKDNDSYSRTPNKNIYNYEYNGLFWSHNLLTNRYTIDKSEIDKIKLYWRKRISKSGL